jgi:hypothetical protein
MNQGKRYVRNSVLALYGAGVVFVGLNRLYASTLDTQTPQWLRGSLTLGLTEIPKREPPPQLSSADLAALHDFSRLNVGGDFEVEIVGAAQYKVTFTPPPGSNAKIRARQRDDELSLHASDDQEAGGKGVLRIEMPTLERLDVQDASQLTLRGLQAEEVTVNLHNVAAARLQQNQVAHWKIHSSDELEVQVDKSTLSAGSLQTQGNLAIRYGEQTP